MPTKITFPDIVSQFRKFKMDRIADRILELKEYADADGESLNLESLNSLLMILGIYPHLRTARISATPRWFLLAEWDLYPDGLLAMEFRPPLIAFAGVVGDPNSNKPFIKSSGQHGLDDVMIATKYFRERFACRWTSSTPV